MKFNALIIASVAAVALASPMDTSTNECKPATYQCDYNAKTGKPGWSVCSTNGRWVFAGDCPPDTVCKFLAANGSPYCVPWDFNF
ncbi:hypothetical protein K4F52_003326 [Lecanicillium sp. MT-2017a]|nr:hypothetical protein K4F52_003326 [Lecanicillium sp. MT-2017a]